MHNPESKLKKLKHVRQQSLKKQGTFKGNNMRPLEHLHNKRASGYRLLAEC